MNKIDGKITMGWELLCTHMTLSEPKISEKVCATVSKIKSMQFICFSNFLSILNILVNLCTCIRYAKCSHGLLENGAQSFWVEWTNAWTWRICETSEREIYSLRPDFSRSKSFTEKSVQGSHVCTFRLWPVLCSQTYDRISRYAFIISIAEWKHSFKPS